IDIPGGLEDGAQAGTDHIVIVHEQGTVRAGHDPIVKPLTDILALPEHPTGRPRQAARHILPGRHLHRAPLLPGRPTPRSAHAPGRPTPPVSTARATAP